jgi:ethanolaminephosphotransferase
MWLAPNMVTLLGFFFIIGNVILIELLMPDLIGPVRMIILQTTTDSVRLIFE